MTKNIAWNIGSGYIQLTYTGQGSGNISASSSANDALVSRSKNINVITSEGTPTISKQLTIKQEVSPYILSTVRASNVGVLTYTGGVDTLHTSYRYSDYIEIPKNVNGVYCYDVFPLVRGDFSGLCIYDSNKNFLGNGDNIDYISSKRTKESGVTYFGDYNDAKYIRFTAAENYHTTCHLEWVTITVYLKILLSAASNVGILNNNGTADTSYTGFRYSDYIEIPNNATVVSCVKVFPKTGSWTGLLIFDSSKAFLGNGENLLNYTGAAKGETNLNNFSNAKYIRFCYDINKTPCYIVFAGYNTVQLNN